MAVLDMQGNVFKVGQTVACAAKLGVVDGLHIVLREVTRVTETHIYLDNSNRPMQFPTRLCIIS